MNLLLALAGLLLVLSALWEAFETMVLPRTIVRRIRFTRFYYEASWAVVSMLIRRVWRSNFVLAVYGPLSLLGLIGCWAVMMVVGFSLMLTAASPAPFATRLYMSGSTFFTLGIGDEKPLNSAERTLVVLEAGIGFAVLAMVIGYLPVLYQAFSRRETQVALMSAHSKGLPNAVEALSFPLRHDDADTLLSLLRRWEEWAAELYENFVSYPMLAFYRSQQDRTSWLTVLVVVQDVCALLQAEAIDPPSWHTRICDQAERTGMMSRRTLDVLSNVLRIRRDGDYPERLSPEGFEKVRTALDSWGLRLADGVDSVEALRRLRSAYEPQAHRLARHLYLTVPPFYEEAELRDTLAA